MVDVRAVPTAPTAERPVAGVLTRSPVYVLTLVTGAVVTVLGWALATVLDRTVVAAATDLADLVAVLPARARSLPAAVVTLGTVGAVVGVHVWLLAARQLRRLALAYLVFGLATGLAALAGSALLEVVEPGVRARFDNGAANGRSLPTDPLVAGTVALLVLVRGWIPLRGRRAAYLLVAVWLLGALAVPGGPYLGLLLDVGLGMVAGSAVPLALRAPTPRPGPAAVVDALRASGLDLVDLHPADVDARGSEPWFGTTTDGARVFVKVLTGEQRVADLLFRAGRWLRLRRTGDAPPEVSLKRAAEHEAFLSHHARALGLATPRVLAVAEVDGGAVALVYEALAGRSLDHVDPGALTDEVLAATWAQVAHLRAHDIAHRDLRLSNVFLLDGGVPVLIDFGFGEVSAGQQLLDTDVAELIAATSTAVGTHRAVAAAVAGLGPEAVLAAREWLLPVTLTTATRRGLTDGVSLEALRQVIEEVHDPAGPPTGPEPIPGRRFALAVAAVAASYAVAALALGDDLGRRLASLSVPLVVLAAALGLAAHAARGLALRSASRRRVPVGPAITASLAAARSASGPGAWAWAGRALFDALRRTGLSRLAATEAVSIWIAGGLFIVPLLVAGVAASGLRVGHGYLAGVALGTAGGVALLVAELGALRARPIGWDLTGAWGSHRTFQHDLARAAGSLGWWAVAHGLQATGLVAVAQAVGLRTSTEALVVVALVAGALASLAPVPGGLVAAEALIVGGLVVVDVHLGTAAFVAVTTRLAACAHLPLAARWAPTGRPPGHRGARR